MASVLIPARFDSTRFPGKVIAPIGGIPMIQRVLERCISSKADKIYVATDSEKVANAIKNTKAAVIMTGAFATGTDRIAYAAKDIDDDIIINVQADEPFIPHELIDTLIDDLVAYPKLAMNTLCTEFAADEDINNPNHVKVVMDMAGYALYFSRLPIPFNRDNGKSVHYRHLGIYGFHRDFLLRYAALPQTVLENAEKLEQLRALEHGERIRVHKTDYKPISVDTEADLAQAEAYINKH